MRLKGISPDNPVQGYMVKDVLFSLGGRSYRWDLYVAPIDDQFLPGLDFMKYFNIDTLLSRNVLVVNGEHEIPIIFKRNTTSAGATRTFDVGRISVGKRILLKPHSTQFVKGKISKDFKGKGDVCFSPLCAKRGVVLRFSIYHLDNNHDGTVMIEVKNLSPHHTSFREGVPLGSIEEVEVIEESTDQPSSGEGSDESVRTCAEEEPSSSENTLSQSNDAKTIDVQEKLLDVQSRIPEHLKDMFLRSCVNLTDEQSIEFGEVLLQYQDVFAQNDNDLGCFTATEHSIDTGDAKPIKQRMRRVPLGFADEEEVYLKKMLDSGVIQPSNSEWASPCVLIRKKDGTVRWCIDFRALNEVTKKDAFPLPLIEECMDALEGVEFMSTLDMNSGYYQFAMSAADRCKTAFLTKYGLFEFTRMAMGLCNAPATFQRAVQLVFRGMLWKEILTYLDDLNVIGTSFRNHLNNLVMSFDRLREYCLKLKPRKCIFFQKEVPFLGKLATTKGIAIDPSKVKAITTWPEPTCRKEVESFLGFANYHRNHIKDYAAMAGPLYQLTGPKAEFHWDDIHQEAFDALKEALTCAPVLAYPNSRDIFILDTDASDTAIGAELLQFQEGEERVISYGSFSLLPSQRNYCTTKKELLAVLRFTREYRHYLLGRKFLIRTDHSSLTWLMRFRNAEGMLARWLEELNQYDMVIQHRPGKQHANADSLSRIPQSEDFCNCYEAGIDPSSLPCGGCKFCTKVHNQWARFEQEVDDVIPLAIRSASLIDSPEEILSADFDVSEEESSWLPRYSTMELREAQKSDSELQHIFQWLENGVTPELNDLYLCSPAIKRFWLARAHLKIKDGVLYYQWEGDKTYLLLMVPLSMKDEILQGCHDCPTSGHLGQTKTLARVKKSFMWHDMRQDTIDYVRSCPKCNKMKSPRVKPKAALGCFRAGARMERVHMDMLGPFPPTESGNRHIMLMVDQFSKWVEIHPLPDITAETTANCAMNTLFTRFGVPLQIHTDQGKNFDSNLMKALCHLYRVTKTRTTPYRPASNGQVERYNRVLLQLIRCYREARDKNWDKDLQILASAIRSMEHRATGYSANMMMLGMEVIQPIDILMRTQGSGDDHWEESPADYVTHLKTVLREVHKLASEKLRTQLKYQKRHYDLKLQQVHYEVGNLVYKLNSATKVGESKKLKPVWVGPLIVTEVLSPILFKVKDRKREYILHHDKLKACTDRVVPMWLRKLRHNMLDLDTTIAYDHAEQEDESSDCNPTPTPTINSEDSNISQIPNCMDTPVPDLPNTSIPTADHAMSPPDMDEQDTSNLLLGEEELGLNKLFGDIVHIHAKNLHKKHKSVADNVTTTSRAGRQRKLPPYLRDYHC